MIRLTTIAVISVAALPFACSHAVLYKPAARNWVAAQTCQGGKDCPEFPSACSNKRSPGCKMYAPQSLNANGPPTIKSRGDGSWPSPIGSFGLCGDPEQRKAFVDLKDEPYMLPTPPQETYTAGDIVEFEVGVYAEHFGHYEFRVCDKGLDGATLKSHQEGEDCLKKWVLKRAPPSGSEGDSQPIDTKHPGRWYIGGRAKAIMQVDSLKVMQEHNVTIAGKDWNSDRDGIGLQNNGNGFKMRYIIPEDLHCEACTLQYYWPTANSCAYDDDVADYWKRNGLSSVGSTTPCGKGQFKSSRGEEFWNCADIKVLPKATTPPVDEGRRRGSPSPPRRRTTRRRTPPAPSRRRRRSSSRRRRSSSRRRRRSSSRRRRRKTSLL